MIDKKKILIVEESEEGRKILDAVLSKDINVFFAFDGQEAKRLVTTHKGQFDLIIVDLLTKKADSLSFLNYINTLPEASRIPVVGVTTKDRSDEINLHVYHFEDFIYQPFNPSIVHNRIKNILHSHEYDKSRIDYFEELNKDKKNDFGMNSSLLPVSDLPPLMNSIVNAASLFDYYRVIDPKKNIAYSYKDGQLKAVGKHCYDIWNREVGCPSCIVKKALAHKKPFFKIENSPSGVTYEVVAIPVTINNVSYGLELIKDVTETLFLSDSTTDESGLTLNQCVTRFKDLSSRDSFTGLHNKEFALQEISDYLESGKHVGLAIIDIDKFKEINDTYGHIAGDQVIIYLTNALLDLDTKISCHSGRFGGDEFLVLFSDPKGDASSIIEPLESTLINHVFSKDGKDFRVSFSYGYAESKPGDDVLALIDRADKKMYERKRAGDED
jgi:diguanylate cyclase (GGDEF)-like protein